MKKILVIDNEERFRSLYKNALIDEGYQVDVAESAEEAREKIHSGAPDIITLNIKMPGMDGIELMKKLKTENNAIPIILCSAYGRYKQDFRVWSANAYVVTSTDLGELKVTIRDILKETAIA